MPLVFLWIYSLFRMIRCIMWDLILWPTYLTDSWSKNNFDAKLCHRLCFWSIIVLSNSSSWSWSSKAVFKHKKICLRKVLSIYFSVTFGKDKAFRRNISKNNILKFPCISAALQITDDYCYYCYHEVLVISSYPCHFSLPEFSSSIWAKKFIKVLITCSACMLWCLWPLQPSFTLFVCW